MYVLYKHCMSQTEIVRCHDLYWIQKKPWSVSGLSTMAESTLANFWYELMIVTDDYDVDDYSHHPT